MEQEKIDAFCDFFDCTEEDVVINYDCIDYDGCTCRVLDEDEANEIAEEEAKYQLESHIDNFQIPEWFAYYIDEKLYIKDNIDTSSIASYDGEEIELGRGYFAYRIG